MASRHRELFGDLIAREPLKFLGKSVAAGRRNQLAAASATRKGGYHVSDPTPAPSLASFSLR
jgi:hypothetical protein